MGICSLSRRSAAAELQELVETRAASQASAHRHSCRQAHDSAVGGSRSTAADHSEGGLKI